MLPIRIYELFLHGKIGFEAILSSKTIVVGGVSYKFVGVTLHKQAHYYCLVYYKEQIYWYDGLRAKLGAVGKRLDNTDWFPCYSVFCVNED